MAGLDAPAQEDAAGLPAAAGGVSWNRERAKYHALTPAINWLSKLGILGKHEWIKAEYVGVADDNILIHEGRHTFTNTRYKEWWYFDAHLNNGMVISCAIVRSIVRPHYFVWLYDPDTDSILLEIEHDGDVAVNEFGSEGLCLNAELVQIEGRSDEGYVFSFQGESIEGTLEFTSPIPARAESHHGANATYYGLYQVPEMLVSGELRMVDSSAVVAVEGAGYHDHWWGIINRYTKWEWEQVRFDNGWVVGIYQGRYALHSLDYHRYAWLYRPGTGYTYFDKSTLVFRQATRLSWETTVSGPEGVLTMTAEAIVERYQYKPVVLLGIALGDVHYYQYPIRTIATFEAADGTATELASSTGLLEWDWDAIW